MKFWHNKNKTSESFEIFLRVPTLVGFSLILKALLRVRWRWQRDFFESITKWASYHKERFFDTAVIEKKCFHLFFWLTRRIASFTKQAKAEREKEIGLKVSLKIVYSCALYLFTLFPLPTWASPSFTLNLSSYVNSV